MRLWHEALIPYLPRQQLLGQHRECAALRGKGWGKKHATVNYVFEHPYGWLWLYHFKVIQEMQHRGYKVSPEWIDLSYRGKAHERLDMWTEGAVESEYAGCRALECKKTGSYIYPEHNDAYMNECLDNLEAKGVLPEVIMNLRNSFVCEGTSISEGSKLYLNENFNITENTVFVWNDGKLEKKELSPSELQEILDNEFSIEGIHIDMNEDRSNE